MLVELAKYKDSHNFRFHHCDILAKVCNAPKDKAGIYIVYAIKNKKKELVYIGRSGKVKSDGSLFIRRGGIWNRLVYGKRDGEARRNFWIREISSEKMEALEIHWYVTHSTKFIDCPAELEDNLIKKYSPRWNRT